MTKYHVWVQVEKEFKDKDGDTEFVNASEPNQARHLQQQGRC